MECLYFIAVVFYRLEVMERCSHPPPPPLPSDDLKPPPRSADAESQQGEPHSGAFGIGTRVAGSVSLRPVLLPSAGNR